MRRSTVLWVLVATSAMGGVLFTGCGGDTSGTGSDESGGSAGLADSGPDTSTGGSSGVGGADTGPEVDAGDGGPPPCATTSFVQPTDASVLTEKDDLDSDCSNGVQYDVIVATSAASGTQATLTGGGKTYAASVSGATAKFSNVTFPVGTTSLSVQVGTSSKCTTSASVTASCAGLPTCTISKPVISSTHPILNKADDVAAAGNPFQAAFEVTTNVEDGQQVQLTVDGSLIYPAVASGGKATHAGVTLSPDGTHAVTAKCTAKSGLFSTATASYLVDVTLPDLTIPAPADGKHFGPADDVDPSTPGLQFQVCGSTNAPDAVGVTQGPPPNPTNFCVGIGSSTPTCAAISAPSGDGGAAGSACVNVTCPGGAPFDLKVTLYDAAGNPTTKTVSAVSCASTLPSVQIVDPTDGTGTDVTKRILATGATQARKDQDPNKPGAQYTVTACTDSATGNATLKLGLAGGALAAWNSTPVAVTPAQAIDGCPNGLGYVIRFPNADAPESNEDIAGALTTATEMVVDVQDVSLSIGSSPAVDVWVDSVAPTLSAYSPNPLCGKLYQSSTDVSTSVQFLASAGDVQLAVASNGTTQAYTLSSYSGGLATFSGVTFAVGSNVVTASAKEPAGNVTTLPAPCSVSVGTPPVVTWMAPAIGINLCAASNLSSTCIPDGDSNAAGWQGTLQVHVAVGGTPANSGTVTFAAGTTTLGTANIDGSGNATLSGATVPKGAPVQLRATTSAFAGIGSGIATISPVVDDSVPGAATGLTATVKARRQTSFRLAWTAPADGPDAVAGYDIRVSTQPITAANFASAEKVVYTGVPASPGTPDGIDVAGREIETDYYFAIQALDLGGNVGTIVTTGPTRASFNVTVLSPPAGGSSTEGFGYSADGSADLDGDGLSDLIVGGIGSNRVLIFSGNANFASGAPFVTITGSSLYFGISAVVVGDVDGDGRDDIAVSGPLSGNGRVYIFKGRASWPSTLSEAQADYVIDTDSTYAGSFFGTPIVRLGDFNGDGRDDFGIGCFSCNGGAGQVVIVLGTQTFPTTVSIPASNGTRTVTINGDPAEPNGNFGVALLGLGKFYTVTSGTSLVVSAYGAANSAGRLYAFHGQGAVGVISATSADNTVVGPAANAQIGYPLALLGPSGSAYPGLGAGNPYYVSNSPSFRGSVTLSYGSPSSGPFAGMVRALTNSALQGSESLGIAVIGGGFSGTSTTTSFVGDTTADVAVAATKQGGIGARVYVLDGAKVASLASSSDVTSNSAVSTALPADWAGTSPGSSAIRDINGDGYGDIAIGEYTTTAKGRLAVIW